MLQKAEQQALDAQKFQDALGESEEWISTAKSRLQERSAPHGDRSALRAKLASLEELRAAREEGERRVEACVAAGKKVAAASGPTAKSEIDQLVEGVESDLEGYCNDLDSAQLQIQDALDSMDKHDEAKDDLVQWLKAKERQAKEKPLGGSAEEKQEQLRRAKVSRKLRFFAWPRCM